jgi:hypothetical protein
VGFHGILLFVFREHYRSGFTNSNADSNSYAQSNAYAHTNTNTNRDSYTKPNANSHRNPYADSGPRHRCHQSHYFRSTGKPQL